MCCWIEVHCSNLFIVIDFDSLSSYMNAVMWKRTMWNHFSSSFIGVGLLLYICESNTHVLLQILDVRDDKNLQSCWNLDSLFLFSCSSLLKRLSWFLNCNAQMICRFTCLFSHQKLWEIILLCRLWKLRIRSGLYRTSIPRRILYTQMTLKFPLRWMMKLNSSFVPWTILGTWLT